MGSDRPGLWARRRDPRGLVKRGSSVWLEPRALGGESWGWGGRSRGSERVALSAHVSQLDPNGRRLAGPERSRMLPAPPRFLSLPLPLPPLLPFQGTGKRGEAGAGPFTPLCFSSFPSPGGTSLHTTALTLVPLISLTICSSI